MVAQLLYGSGLRLMEACTLRVKDVDLERRQLAIDARGGGGHVELPSAYGRKSPTASREYVDVDSGERRRHQVHETVVLRVVKEAARVAGLRIHGHLMAENCRTAVTDVYGKAGRVWLATLTLRAATRLQVDLLPEVIDALNVRIRQMDQNVARLARHHAVAPQLQTVPGIGVFGAMLFLA